MSWDKLSISDRAKYITVIPVKKNMKKKVQ